MAVTDSTREKIAVNIVDTLKQTITDDTRPFTIKKVVREPVIINDLAATSMPLVFVQSANETREDTTMGGSAITRMGTIDFVLHIYIKSGSRDTDRNTLLEIIDTALEADRTRGSNALDTQVIDIALITTGESAPYASLAITVQCEYCFTKGTS